ncbi:MAG: YunC family protein [Planctomycetes bacterium]|nr:YunC family protein [Planctomycetota bacterium]
MDDRPDALRPLCWPILLVGCLFMSACRQSSETQDTDSGMGAPPASPPTVDEPAESKMLSDADSEPAPHADDAFWNGFTRESVQLGQILLIVKGSKGLAGCTYLNLDTFERFGEACAIIPAGNFDKMLDAKVSAATSQAKELGIEVGMSGREALELLR